MVTFHPNDCGEMFSLPIYSANLAVATPTYVCYSLGKCNTILNSASLCLSPASISAFCVSPAPPNLNLIYLSGYSANITSWPVKWILFTLWVPHHLIYSSLASLSSCIIIIIVYISLSLHRKLPGQGASDSTSSTFLIVSADKVIMLNKVTTNPGWRTLKEMGIMRQGTELFQNRS